MTDWADRSNCRGINAEVFFVERNLPGQKAETMYDEAKAVCAGCVVKSECLNYALDANEIFGVWGGKSPKERRAVKRERFRTAAAENPKARQARYMRATQRWTVAEIASQLGVSARTVERWTAGKDFPRVTPERPEKPWCAHCDADRAAASDGICRACDEYRRKYGHLPDMGVLVRRWRTRDARRKAAS